MRLIDADALIEKCGDWYVEEGTESGFIGTLKNLLATEPTIQPQSITSQLNDGARSTAQSTDLIDRGQAIEKFTMTAPQMSVIRIYEAVEILESMPTIQPEKAQLSQEGTTKGTTSDLISRQAAIDAANDWYEGLICGSINGLIKRLNALPTIQPEPQWIPVSERLPEDLEEVNVTWVNRNPESYYESIKDKPFTATAVYYKGKWYWWSTCAQDLLAEYGERCNVGLLHEAIEVTAWMPLPTPYQKGATP